MLAVPAASRAVGRSTRVSPPQVQPERPGLPCANGFNGVLRALPGVHDLLVTVAGRSSPADLAPAKGCQDHTSSSVRKKRRSSREALRPSHPALNVRDDAYAPLVEAGRREDVHDFRFSEREIFSRPAGRREPPESAAEFRFFAPFILLASEPRARRSQHKIAQLICPTSDFGCVGVSARGLAARRSRSLP